MVRQLRGAGVRRDLARDLTRASSPLLVAPLGGVGLGRSDGTGPAEGCYLWRSSVWRGTCWRGRGGYRGRSSGRGLAAPALLLVLIHRSAWNRNSTNFGCIPVLCDSVFLCRKPQAPRCVHKKHNTPQNMTTLPAILWPLGRGYAELRFNGVLGSSSRCLLSKVARTTLTSTSFPGAQGGEWFVTNDGIEHSSSRPLAQGVR
jgi:hypothetical protein